MSVILTRGLPASGKSTWAKAWVAADPSSRVRVNRDEIRFQLYGKYWGEGVDEQVVTKVEEAMVAAAVEAGKDVVIDATHLAARYITKWRKLYGDVKIEDFVVKVNDLTERDWDRRMNGERGVGPEVIYDLAKRYQIPADGTLPKLPDMPEVLEWKPARPFDATLPLAYIVDIDGTVADMTGVRGPYDTSRYHLDKCHENVARTIQYLWYAKGAHIIFVSGRDSAFRDVTVEWLRDHTLDLYTELYMRPEGDVRNDAIIKHELYHEHIAGRYNVLGVFDDRGRVLRMWRAIGLTTFAVGDTDNYNF